MSVSSRKLRQQPLMANINVVPYIDVMLVLLVIFMITAPLLNQGVKVTLPSTDAAPIKAATRAPIIVSVDRLGRFYLNASDKPTKPLSPHQLLTKVAALYRLNQVNRTPSLILVKGDKDAPYGFVVNAMVLLKKAGVFKVGLLTKGQQRHAV